MTIYCLGSINVDHFYRLETLPKPGETLSARSHAMGLGGKGANQSIAALRAGSEVVHIGAIGASDPWIEGELSRHGLALDTIARVDTATGHAIVAVDDHGENQIIIFSGANLHQSLPLLDQTLTRAHASDTLLLQNETSHQVEAAQRARAKGMKVFYSAAPFDLGSVQAVLPYVTHLLMNAGEAEAFVQATGQALDDLPIVAAIVTHGAKGSEWIVPGHPAQFVPAFPVTPVDTTGAGDCFAGTVAAGFDQGMSAHEAMTFASAAAALQVTRPGTADAMPTHAQVVEFLSQMR